MSQACMSQASMSTVCVGHIINHKCSELYQSKNLVWR